MDKDGKEDEDATPLITNAEDEALLRNLLRSIHDLELSVRSQNCLNNADIRTLGELVTRPEAEMLKYRNFGQKSLTELREKLTELGLTLHMEVPETVRIALEKDYERKRKKSED
jgi:DNA-directed RNA polymerase subunit alpha